MSDNTPRLRIPELVSMQEANCVTWNEALVQLDAFVDLYLLGQYVNTPPSSPADGDAYLVGGTPTGAWSGYAYKIASCIDGAWRFYTPFNGLRATVATTGAFIVYAGGTWTDWNSLISASEVSLASAATCDLGAGSLFVQITGTTTISSFGTSTNKLRFVRFAQALTLTHNATSLILLGGASRTTAAGDVGVYASDASGNWRERSYFRAASNPGDFATKSGTEMLSGKTFSGTTSFNGSAQASPATTTVILGSAPGGSYMTSYMASYRNNLGTVGVDFGYDSTNQILKLITNYWGAGSETPIVIGTYSNSANQLHLAANGAVGVGCAPTSGGKLDVAGHIFPHTDNTYNLGSASCRFGTVYAGTGTINTSAAAAKTNVHALSEAEIAVAKALAAKVRAFQFADAVAEKGDQARLHIGMIHEEVVAAFEAAGLDPLRYGIVCRDPAVKTVTKTRPATDEEGNAVEETYEEVVPDLDETGGQKWVLGLRYGELAQFVMAGLAARLAALEAKVGEIYDELLRTCGGRAVGCEALA